MGRLYTTVAVGLHGKGPAGARRGGPWQNHRVRRAVSRWWLAASLASVAALPAAAQVPGERVVTHTEAFVRMRQAQAAVLRNDLDEAVRLYREAAEAGAPPAVFRELARVLEQQSRWREAAGAWTRYASLAPRPDDRAAAVARREALRTMLTALRVRVTPPEAARQARVWIDREPPRWYPAGGVEAVSEGGRHRVRVEARGYVPWERMVPTSFGEPVEVVAVMVPAPTTTPTTTPTR